MGDSVVPASTDPVASYLKKYGKGGGTPAPSGDPVASYLATYGKGGASPHQAAIPPMMRTAPDATRVTPGKGDFSAMVSGIRGIAASAPQAIPGMEALQAGVRSVVRQQPYKEALSDMRAETDPVPAPIKLLAQTPAMLAMGRLPMSPATAGAALGGASQALKADPTSLKDRAVRTGIGAVAGGVTGKALDAATTLVRAKVGTPSPGNLVGNLKSKMNAADERNYGSALSEGETALMGRTSDPIRAALERPDVKPFADQVRASRQFADANDARVLHETFKLMGKQQGGLVKRLARDGYDAQLSLQADNIARAKDELLNAADDVMPSYRDAVAQHRDLQSEIGAVGKGVDAARRVIGRSPSGARLATQSEEAYAKQLQGMTPKNQAAARQGILGELRERTGIAPNVVSAGGLLTSIQRPAKIASFLRSTGDSQQSLVDYLIRMGLIGGSTAAR